MPGIMKAFAVLAVLFVAARAADDYCYRNITHACNAAAVKGVAKEVSCNSKYGAIDHLQTNLRDFASNHILQSFEYLLMSTHYANYELNREGFEKLYRSLSDDKWNSAIGIIKHITKRGGSMKFAFKNRDTNSRHEHYEVYELQGLAMAIDMEKEIALHAHDIHDHASAKRAEYHDPEISDYIEEEFVHKQADSIRKLSGYTNDLLNILNGPEPSLGLYLFDDYLQKQ